MTIEKSGGKNSLLLKMIFHLTPSCSYEKSSMTIEKSGGQSSLLLKNDFSFNTLLPNKINYTSGTANEADIK
jgi:hypothetical protein